MANRGGGPVALVGEVLVRLLERSHEMHPADVQRVVAEEARAAGFEEVELLLVDHHQQALTSLASGERSGVEGTVAGDAFRRGRVHAVGEEGAGVRIHLPLVSGRDRQGVMAARVAAFDSEIERAASAIAAYAAELVVAKGAYTDELELRRRTGDMDLSAELRWASIPPLTIRTPQVTISGILEPAYEIAGDTFDYAVNRDVAHFGLFDAVGHGMRSAQLANLAVGTYRHARRQRLPLDATCTAIDQRVREEFGDCWFVTALLGELHLGSGRLLCTNAGHPRPLIVRSAKVVREVGDGAALPLGLAGAAPEVAETQLEPGDLALVYSDGVTESRAANGELFGVGRLVDHVERSVAAELPPAETLRRLVAQLLGFQARLRDDATLLCAGWRLPGADDSPPG